MADHTQMVQGSAVFGWLSQGRVPSQIRKAPQATAAAATACTALAYILLAQVYSLRGLNIAKLLVVGIQLQSQSKTISKINALKQSCLTSSLEGYS